MSAKPTYVAPSITKATTLSRGMYEVNVCPLGHNNPRWDGSSGWTGPADVDGDGVADNPDQYGNPQWVWQGDGAEYAQKLKLTPATVITGGHLNSASMWATDDGVPLKDINWRNLDWSKLRQWMNPEDTGFRAGVKACSRVARNPIYNPGLPPLRPMVLDLEYGAFNGYSGAPLDAAAFGTWSDVHLSTFQTFRNVLGMDYELYAYMALPSLVTTLRTPDVLNRFDQFQRLLTGPGVCLYNNTAEAATGGESWYAKADYAAGLIDEWHTTWRHTKLAFVCPVYAMDWVTDSMGEFGPAGQPYPWSKLNGKPVPLTTWNRQIKHLVDGGWKLFLWMGNTLIDGLQKHFDTVAKYAA